MNANKNVYQKMLKLARQWSTEARQIDSDVNRQFREHVNYRERYSVKQKSLFNILTAYSMYNMEVMLNNLSILKSAIYNIFSFFCRLDTVKECLELLVFYSCT